LSLVARLHLSGIIANTEAADTALQSLAWIDERSFAARW
jgi:predicted negative regulator of RcsB-dependent stress response